MMLLISGSAIERDQVQCAISKAIHNPGADANTDNTLSIKGSALYQLAPAPFRDHPWRNLLDI